MSRKYQWYVCNLVLAVSILAACASPATEAENATATPIIAEVVTTPDVTPTLIPKSGDLIFLEFFAIT
jgi:hypothetical protein